jgi:transglutaminase-like putative cysteine protease
VAGGGFDAVLASSMLRSARIPAKTAARVVGAILRTPGPAGRQLSRGLLRQLAVASAATRTTSRNWTAGCRRLLGVR